jgi:hypothetical protein
VSLNKDMLSWSQFFFLFTSNTSFDFAGFFFLDLQSIKEKDVCREREKSRRKKQILLE